jgi:hypothetical protein
MTSPDIDAPSQIANALRTKIFQAEAHWHFKEGWLYSVRVVGDRLRVVVTTPEELREEKLISSTLDECGDEMFAYLKQLHCEWRKRNGKVDVDDIILA